MYEPKSLQPGKPLRLALLPIAVAASLIVGCDGDGRVGARGTVSVDGQPLQEGTIHFAPVEIQAPASGAKVAAGRYEIDAQRGLQPGTYRVTIEAFGPSGQKVNDPERGPIDELVPLQFLNAGQMEVLVKPTQRNQFDFALTRVVR